MFSSARTTPSPMNIVKANILIDEDGRARLADFGLLAIIPDTTNLVSSNSFTQAGTHRWMSPELFDPKRFRLKHSRPTESSDCYALGMVVYEVLSGNVPFYRLWHLVVIPRVLEGERPKRPRGAKGVWFNDDIWTVLERCWKPTPSDRPKVTDVLLCLQEVSRSPPRAMDLGSSVEDGTDESEASSPSRVAPPESSSGFPPIRRLLTAPDIAGTQKRQKVDTESQEQHDPVVSQGADEKVRLFLRPTEKCH